MKKLPLKFYQQKDVISIANQLIGKIVSTNINGKITSGRIVEAEAYLGLTDRASHSFNGRRTQRNEHMYAKAGTVYVYICYGMHQMLNVVTNDKNIPDAVLIRAIEPTEGLRIMAERTGKPIDDYSITRGPGNVCKALGISKMHSGKSFLVSEISLWQGNNIMEHNAIGISKRIGVEGAGKEAADKPYRFYLKGNKYVSGSPRN